MAKDSKLGIHGKWLVLAALIVMAFVWSKESSAVELEVGPTLLSGEYSEGGALLVTETVGKFSFAGGYIYKQTCHCTDPADLEENIFFQVQRVAVYKKLEVGIGPAYFQNTNRALGKNLTFSLSLGYGGEKWSIRFRHYSNAGSGSPNLGQDMITVGYSF